MTDPATPPEQPPSDAASTVENTPAEKPWTPETWTPEPWTPETPPAPPQPAATEAPVPQPQAPPALPAPEPPNPYAPAARLPPAPTYNPGYQQQPYGSPYPPPAYGYGYGYVTPTQQELRQQRTGLAIGALVCSLIGILTCGIGSIAGVVMGHISYGQAKRGEAGGQGLALSAVIIGYVVLALWAGFIVASFLTGLFEGINAH
jgi:hypothetical protein